MLLWAVPLVYLISLWLGGSNAFVALTVFSYMYNDLDGANEHFLTRNLLNACGLSAIGLGAAEVATGYGEFSIRRNTIEWIAILALVITTTVQMQDLPDVEGDKARERRTFPLVYGDRMARWSVAATVFPWSVLCPYYWKLSVWFYVPSCSLGATIAFRVLYCKTIAQHEVTWKFWCFWMMALYLLPLHARSGQ
jgi:4-hydroxybenzoate polyprenyltransferase